VTVLFALSGILSRGKVCVPEPLPEPLKALSHPGKISSESENQLQTSGLIPEAMKITTANNRSLLTSLAIVLLLLSAAAFLVFRQGPSTTAGTVMPEATRPAVATPDKASLDRASLDRASLDRARLIARLQSAEPGNRPLSPAETQAVEATAAAFENFGIWSAEYQSAAPAERATMLARGTTLAGERRAAMKWLITRDPESALAMAANAALRDSLPPAITTAFEQVLAGKGNYTLDVSCPDESHEDHAHHESELTRMLAFEGCDYRANVYGRRSVIATKNNLPFQGVAIDDEIALFENGVLPVSSGLPIVSVLLARQPAAASADPDLAYFRGSEFQVASSAADVPAISSAQNTSEDTPGPDGDAADSAWTEGAKTLLYIRAVFSNSAVGSEPLSISQAQTHQDNVALFYRNNSYDKASVASTFTPTVTLPQTDAAYDAAGWTTMLADARAAALAAGFRTSDYTFYVVATPKVPGFSWAGRAFIGGSGSHYNGDFTLRVAAHELGHNFGLYHANYNYTPSENPVSREAYAAAPDNSPSQEYGDRYDMMGTLGTTTAYHFSSREKYFLDWIDEADVPIALQSGIYRIFRHDHRDATGLRALRVPSGDSTRPHFWLGYRKNQTSNNYLSNGLDVIWGKTSNASDGHLLIDTTPFSNDGNHADSSSADNNDKVDAALTLGRMFGSPDSGAWFTVTGQGGTSPDEYLDVTVNVGNFSRNRPPVVFLTPATSNVAANATANFTATASDPDGDPVTFSWDFDDGNFSGTQASVSRSWPATGRYVVRVTAVDGKGGSSSATCVVRVGSPTTFTVSGRVTSGGQPVEGVRVFNGKTGSTYRGTHTDSDGRYTLPNLAGGSYSIEARKDGYVFGPLNFTNALSVSANLTGKDFDATTSPGPYVVVDNKDASGVEITASSGSWQVLSSANGFHANDYLTDNNTYKGLKQVVFRPDLPSPGLYRVYMRYPQSSNRATNAPVDVVHSNGSGGTATDTFAVNQTVNGGTWLQLGTFNFAAGTQGFARVRTDGSNGHVAADAFKFEIATPDASGVRIVTTQPLARERGLVPATIRLEREGPLDDPVTVFLGSIPPGESDEGIATAGADYTALPASFTIPAGQATLDIPVSPLADNLAEGDETASFALRHVPDPMHEWFFSESVNTTLTSVVDSGPDALAWTVPIEGVTTTGAGVLRIRKPDKDANGVVVNGITHVVLPASPALATTKRYLLVETAGWSFSGTSPQESIRFGFTTGANDIIVAQMNINRLADGVYLEGQAYFSTGPVIMTPVQLSSSISTTEPWSFLLMVDPVAKTYTISYRSGSDPFVTLGTAATSPSRIPGAFRMNVIGILNSLTSERFDVDRIAIGGIDPTLPYYNILEPSEAVVTIKDDPRDDWRFHRFSAEQRDNPLLTAWSADPDNDGLRNVQEFAFGRSPAIPDSPSVATLGKVNISGNDYLSITFTRRTDEELLGFVVQATGDVSSPVWPDIAILHGDPVPAGEGFETVTYRDIVPVTTGQRRFMRVRTILDSP